MLRCHDATLLRRDNTSILFEQSNTSPRHEETRRRAPDAAAHAAAMLIMPLRHAFIELSRRRRHAATPCHAIRLHDAIHAKIRYMPARRHIRLMLATPPRRVERCRCLCYITLRHAVVLKRSKRAIRYLRCCRCCRHATRCCRLMISNGCCL